MQALGRHLLLELFDCEFDAISNLDAVKGALQGLRDWVDVATRGSILVSADLAKERLGWRPRFDSAGALCEFARQRKLLQSRKPRA